MKQIIGDTCNVECFSSKKVIVADILEFKELLQLVVSINKSIKLHMRWNGRVYEGNYAGLTFTSSGPKIRTVKISR